MNETVGLLEVWDSVFFCIHLPLLLNLFSSPTIAYFASLFLQHAFSVFSQKLL